MTRQWYAIKQTGLDDSQQRILKNVSRFISTLKGDSRRSPKLNI